MVPAVKTVFGLAADRDYEPGGQPMSGIIRDLLQDAGRDPAEFDARHAEFSLALETAFNGLIAAGSFDIRPCPGGPELVTRLAAAPDIQLGLLTGNPESVARGKLRAAGYDDGLFPVGAYGDEHPDRAELVGWAIRRAGDHTGVRFDPAAVVLIGDTLRDVESGHAHGVRVIAVGTGETPAADLADAGADLVLNDLMDGDRILAIIRGEHPPITTRRTP